MRAIDADRLIDDLKHDVAIDQDSLDYEELTDSNREKIQFDKDCKQNAIDLLQNAPTIPSAQPEIVMCKDCKHYKAYEYTGELACHYVIGGTVRRNPNDFCSRAERITDEWSD